MRVCRACGYPEHGLDRCEVAARKRASNGASNAVAPISSDVVQRLVENAKRLSGYVVVKAALAESGKKQRWDREKYNANAARYMREYRASRKKSRGNPSGVST